MPRFTATPLFNAAFDLAASGTPLIVNGERYSQYFDGWKPGVPLKPSVLHEVTVEAADERQAAETVFRVLNSDDRPNSKQEPSLSVGDIVIIHTHDSDIPFAVQPIGFTMVNMFEVDAAIVRH